MLLALFIIVFGGAVVSCSEEVDQLTEANFGSKDFDIKIHSTSLEAGDEIVMNIEAKTDKAKGSKLLVKLNDEATVVSSYPYVFKRRMSAAGIYRLQVFSDFILMDDIVSGLADPILELNVTVSN